jgi:hypothetical protein
MGERELEELFSMIQLSFVVKRKSWDDIEEDDPTDDELEAINAYYAERVTA